MESHIHNTVHTWGPIGFKGTAVWDGLLAYSVIIVWMKILFKYGMVELFDSLGKFAYFHYAPTPTILFFSVGFSYSA